MPINYHVKKPMHCSKLNPSLQDSIQGCKFKTDEIIEFKPMNRVKGNSSMPKPAVSPRQQIIPVTLGRTSNVPLLINNNIGFSVVSNQPTVNEDPEKQM